jgi:hypothetical protein
MNKMTLLSAISLAIAVPYPLLAVGPKPTIAQAATPEPTTPSVKKKKAQTTPTSVIAPTLAPIAANASAAISETQSSSEFFHQAEFNQREITPIFSYSTTNIYYKNLDSPTSASVEDVYLGANAEYGLSPRYSVGVTLLLDSSDTSYTPGGLTDNTSKGLTNPIFTFKGRQPIDIGTIYYGANLSVSPDKSRTNSTGDANAYSGGNTLTPYLGIEAPLRRALGIAGARFSYDVYKGDVSSEVTNSAGTITGSTTRGGETLGAALFYERPYRSATIAASVTYAQHAKTKTISGNTNTTNDNAYNSYDWRIYGTLPLAPQWTLLPSLHYGVYNSDDNFYSQYIDHVNGWGADVAARMVF